MAPPVNAYKLANSKPEATEGKNKKQPPKNNDKRQKAKNNDEEAFSFMDAILELKKFFADYSTLLKLGRQLRNAQGNDRK
ncbi:hypothetical protein TNCV_1389111 [Trichonephila clavipes]|nr:hypothetical protein TNCV_1389111 [Trichonephila clavipes]